MLLVRFTAGDEEHDGMCVNLALGGMFIQALHKLPYGAELTVKLTLPTGDKLSIPARVRWVAEDGFGVQHGILGASDTKALADYVASLEGGEDTGM